MTEAEIEKLAIKHEEFGFGESDGELTTHGFEPAGLLAFALELIKAAKDDERKGEAGQPLTR
jgi:hypothetical protein